MYKIVELIHGSHLYGTNTQASDRDFKGCFLSPLRDIILKKDANTITTTTGGRGKNTSEDEDVQFFSLHKLLTLAYKGEMNIIDMIHAPDDMIIESSPEWEFIRSNRSRFYTKNMRAYFGYIMSQTNKYSLRGGRFLATKEVVEFLEECNPDTILQTYWNDLPLNKYSRFIEDERGHAMFECCGRKVHPTVTVAYALSIYKVYLDNYGGRARDAAEQKADYKAVSHAFRAVEQIEEMLETGDIVFPLRNKERILEIKLGKQKETPEELFEELSERTDVLKNNLDASDLPEKVNIKFWEEWLLDLYYNKMK